MVDQAGAISAYDLSVWLAERTKEIPSKELRDQDRLLRLITSLLTARGVIDLKQREIERLEGQLRFATRQKSLQFASIRRLQEQAAYRHEQERQRDARRRKRARAKKSKVPR